MVLRLFKVSLVFCVSVIAQAQAGVVYKTIDEQGHVSYTDVEPIESGLLVEKIALQNYGDVIDSLTPGEALDQTSEVADRLKQDRLAREELKIKRLEAQRQLAQVNSSPPVIENRFFRSFSPRHRYFRRFPSIHYPHYNYKKEPTVKGSVAPLRRADRVRNTGRLIVPKSRLLTP